MNILFFSRLFYPHIGGVEKHVLEISKILIEKGHKIVVVTELYDKRLDSKETVEGIKIYRIPNLKEGWFKKIKIWKWLLTHKDLIMSADVIHCHDVFFWYFPFIFLFPKKSIYTTFHGYEGYPISKKNILIRRISERLSKGSIGIGSFMNKWYGTKPDYVTYGGVNIANMKYEISKIKNKDSALFIGRLDEQTGIQTYVNAIRLIRKKIPGFELLVVGDGKFKKNIKKDIQVLGFQESPEKYFDRYRFAFVSRYLSIFEAMASKRLVFSVYDNPLKRDYLQMAPFSKLINIITTKEELSSLVLFYLNNPNKEKKMVRDAFEWVKNQTWEKVVRIYINLWRNNK